MRKYLNPPIEELARELTAGLARLKKGYVDAAEELARILGHGAPDGPMLDRALEIVREGGSIDHAQAAVTAEVARATALARRLPDGAARHALIQLARFLAARCGAGQPDDEPVGEPG